MTQRPRAESELQRLADEQAALRRVATLVARGVPPAEVFPAVAAEVSVLFGSDVAAIARFEDDGTATVLGDVGGPHAAGTRVTLDPGYVMHTVRATRRSARFDTDNPPAADIGSLVRSIGVRSAVASPILVEGELWGAITGASLNGPLSSNAERRLTEFTELVATAVANAEAREELTVLAEEQAALRRVATLVAEDVPPSQLFRAVTQEVGTLLGVDFAGMARFEDDMVFVIAAWAAVGEHPPVPPGWPMQPGDPASTVAQTGGPVRWDDLTQMDAPIVVFGREVMGIRSTVGCPIVVGGRVWGALAAHTKRSEPLPPDTELRIARFANLVGTAVGNAGARADVARLAQEQAALRRVATLVARGASQADILAAIAKATGELLGVREIRMLRFEDDRTALVVASAGEIEEGMPVGSRHPLGGDNATSEVFRTGRPARIDSYETAGGPIADVARMAGVRGVVVTPIQVESRLWGAMVAVRLRDEPLPTETESRLGQFTELMATAIANTDSRNELTASRARLVTAENEARRRVVRDLHDGAQQRIVHTIVTLKLAQSALEEQNGHANSLVCEALEHAQQSNEELRKLAHGILPTVLTRGGLRAGVDSLVSRIDLPVHVDVVDGRFASEIEGSAYFLVAEALTNVVKHSKARRAEVRASVENGVLRLEVHDDGIGGADPGGDGLVGMSDRLTALGGRLEVASPAEGGTLLTATLPLT